MHHFDPNRRIGAPSEHLLPQLPRDGASGAVPSRRHDDESELCDHDAAWIVQGGVWRMYWKTALILFALWLLGFGAFRITSPMIHLVLVLALITFLWHVRVGNGNAL
jgi:hypothetical protein